MSQELEHEPRTGGGQVIGIHTQGHTPSLKKIDSQAMVIVGSNSSTSSGVVRSCTFSQNFHMNSDLGQRHWSADMNSLNE